MCLKSEPPADRPQPHADSLRALALEAVGYKTQVIEFIDMEHTPKNILIRAMKTDSNPRREESLKAYQSQKELLGIGEIRTDWLLQSIASQG